MSAAGRTQVLIIAALLLSTPGSSTAQHRMRPAPHPLLVGYFPDWGLNFAQPYYVKTLVTSHAAEWLDQINYSQGAVRNGTCSLANPEADVDARFTGQNSVNGVSDSTHSRFHGNFHQFLELKRRYPHLKLVISLEGQAHDFELDAQPQNRVAFVASCVNLFLRGHFASGINQPGLFDGIDVDWETPGRNDAANFEALLREFRRQMDSVRRGLLLTVAVDESPRELAGTDFATIASIVDQVGIMNYDYVGPWSQTTGFVAPLFSPDANDFSSIEHSIDAYKAAGVPEKKLLMGLPFYGYGWSQVDDAAQGLFQRGQGIKQDKPYHHIRRLAQSAPKYRDDQSQEPWLFDGDTFWTFDDPISVRFKVSYAFYQKLGGVMIWELSGDTDDAELLSTAYHALHDPIAAETITQHKHRRPAHTSPGAQLH